MLHPSPAELIAGDAAEVAAHVAACETCRRLRELLRPAADAAAAGNGELPDLVPVDPAHYALHEELRDGVGGMGRTVRATDRRLGRAVAIKQPLTGDEAPLADVLRARFEAEARLTARLEHPAIVTVYEAGRWPDGEPFYAMRLVRGAPLSRLIEQRRTLADRLALVGEVVKVGEALAYAHAQGVIHRDVKPDNILVGPYGQTVLIDWGLARDLDASDDLRGAPSAPGVTVLGIGTPHYMPPEQAAGAAADEKLDIYALGATLYHVLAGEPPYPGDAAAARAAMVAGAPPPLGERVPELPPPLVACVERAMARDPAQRFASMAELVEELHRFARGELLRSYRYGLAERIARWARRHRAVLAVGALALGALAVVAVISVRRILDERDARGRAQLAAEAALAESRARTASLLAPRASTRADALLSAIEAAGTHDSPAVRQGLVDALAAGPLTRTLDAHAGGELLAVHTEDGRIAIAGLDRTLRLWSATGDLIASIPIPIERVRTLLLDTRRGPRALACGYGPEAAWIDLDRRTVTTLPVEAPIGACTITRGGDAVTGRAGELVRWSDAGPIRLPIDGVVDALAIDGTGAILATTGTGELWRWQVDGTLTHAHGHDGAVFGLLPVSSTGALTAGFDGKVVAWELAGASPVPRVVYDEPGAMLAAITAHEDRARPGVLAIAAQNTSEVRVLVADDDRYVLGWRATGHAAWTEDGRMVAVGDDRVAFVAPMSGEPIRVLAENEPGLSTLAVVGHSIVVGNRSGDAALWDLPGDASGLDHVGEVTGLADVGHVGASAGVDGRLIGTKLESLDRPLENGGLGRPIYGSRVLVAGAEIFALRAAAGNQLLAVDTAGTATLRGYGPGVSSSIRRVEPDVLAAALRSDGDVFALAGPAGVTIHPSTGAAVPLAGSTAATAVAFVGDGVVTGHLGGLVRRWTLAGARDAEHALATDPRTGIRALAPFDGGVLATWRDRTALLDGRTLAERAAWPLEQIGEPGPDAWVGAMGARAQLVNRSGPPRDLVGHAAVVTVSAFAPGLAATGDQAGLVIVWDLATAQPIVRVHPVPGAPAVTALAFLGTQTIAIGDARGTVRRVPLTTARGVEVACEKLRAIGRATETTHCR